MIITPLLELATIPFLVAYSVIRFIERNIFNFIDRLPGIRQHRFLQSNTSYPILITGCGSGFGKDLALTLDQQGWTVLATVRREKSGSALKSLSKRSRVVQCDITNNDDVQRVAQMIKNEYGGKLHALVNNGGVSGGQAVLEMLPLSEIRHIMETNYFGAVQTTKALLPFICNTKAADARYGRIINVTSVAGIVSPPTLAAYSASKYAFEAFSDGLRRELQCWNIPVSKVQPGFMSTKMVLQSKDETNRVFQDVDKDILARYGEAYADTDRFDLCVITSEHPHYAIKDLMHATTNVAPRITYLPGLQASLLFEPCSLLPTWVQDLFCPSILGMVRPHKLAPNQPIHWTYWVSEFSINIIMTVWRLFNPKSKQSTKEAEHATAEKDKPQANGIKTNKQ